MRLSLLTFLICCASIVNGVSQHRLSSALKQEIAHANDREMFRVMVVLAEKADLEPLRERFSNERMTTAERSRTVVQFLTAHAAQTQQPLSDLVDAYRRQHPDRAGEPESLWITNVMTLDASKALILQLAAHVSVQKIDLDSRWRIAPIEPMKAESGHVHRSVGGVEPGLEAIGARFLWNLGYTGRNRIGFVLDTGVWPEHPAIGHRFLAGHVPLEHAWFAYDTRFPADKSSSHGTHCTGTMVGLDPANADTIGMAFNAYFIASDPVVSNLAFLKPLTDFLHAFEWALDPDGDPATLDDVPDVINNSWGFQPPEDTLVCESVVADMLNAVEIAGIANVFAAGNNGPDPMTIGTPNYINTGLVNTFTVGAVNGNTLTYPIADFSSRGPSPCGGGGAIAIKPEVAAPGMSVRSCVAQNEYDFFSGTSMASPHVAGGVLLLKEAFPMASGEEILLAIYNAAIDLGDPGEDNTYGMGMVNLEAAFNLLSQTFSPVPPLTDEYDLAAEVVSPAEGMSCENSVTPVIRLRNLGQQPIDMVHVTFGQVGYDDQQYTWTGDLQSGQQVDVELPDIVVQGSSFTEIWFRTELAIDVIELDRHNNNAVLRFFLRGAETLPFVENFETVTFDDDRWFLENPDGSTTWDTLSIDGPRFSTISAYMNFHGYSPRLDQQDAITSPKLSISPSAQTTTLRFDYFYTFFHQNFGDSLQILVSEDCGSTWETVVQLGGDTMASHGTTGSNRMPQSQDEWQTRYVDLSSFAGEDILIRFLTTNRKGNHFLLDNIWVYSGEEPLGTGQEASNGLTLYPNPGHDDFHFAGWQQGMRYRYTVMDMQGRVQRSGDLQVPHLSMHGMPQGLYLITLENDRARHLFRAMHLR